MATLVSQDFLVGQVQVVTLATVGPVDTAAIQELQDSAVPQDTLANQAHLVTAEFQGSRVSVVTQVSVLLATRVWLQLPLMTRQPMRRITLRS